MKKIIFFVMCLMIVLPVSVSAAQNNQPDNSPSGQSNANISPSPSNNTTPNQAETQTQTNNPDVGTMTQEQTRIELQTELQKSQPTYTPEGQATQTRLNAISQTVQNMLTIASRVATQNTSLSDKIQTVAQAQIQTQDKINQSLDKAESRSGFAKFFIGPNYKQLKTVKQETEQNQLKIQELNQIISQIANVSDQTELKNQIKILEAQNTSLNEQLNQDVQGFSLFGWLSKLVNKY